MSSLSKHRAGTQANDMTSKVQLRVSASVGELPHVSGLRLLLAESRRNIEAPIMAVMMKMNAIPTRECLNFERRPVLVRGAVFPPNASKSSVELLVGTGL